MAEAETKGCKVKCEPQICSCVCVQAGAFESLSLSLSLSLSHTHRVCVLLSLKMCGLCAHV